MYDYVLMILNSNSINVHGMANFHDLMQVDAEQLRMLICVYGMVKLKAE